MSVNNYKILFNETVNNSITIPVELNWDYAGQDQSIEIYQSEVEGQVVGKGYDFETERFPHDTDPNNNNITEINYQFFFFKGNSLSNPSFWKSDYLNQTFTPRELYYGSNSFSKSFFKLDLYDTVDGKRQTNYLTIIIPTNQGESSSIYFNNKPVNVKIPNFKLDYIGNKEGFFIYWLKSLNFLNLNTFYMSAKFYNAKTSKFVKMTNKPQSTVNGDKFNLDSITYYYYRVVLDYVNYTYKVFDITSNDRVGTATNSIKWYEYVNPPQ